MNKKAVSTSLLVGVVVAFLLGIGVGYAVFYATVTPKTVTVTTTLTATAVPTETAKPTERVHLIFGLDWAIYGRHAPYFVAVEKGFFEEEGLIVEVVRGYGSADTISRVASGAVDIGFADFGSLIRAKAANPDLDVKMVAVIYGKAPYTIFTLKSHGISTPKDLEGKTIGGPPGDANRVMFPAFAKLAGIDASKVNWVNIEATAKTQMLLSHQVDAIPEYFMHKAVLEREAAKMGDEVVYFLYADYGLTVYSNGIIVKDGMLKEKPEIVKRFLRALVKAFEYTFEHPDEAVDILLKREPKLDREVARAEIDIVKELVMTPEAQEHGIGYMTREKVEDSIKIVFEAFELGQPTVKPEDVYSMEFLPTKA